MALGFVPYLLGHLKVLTAANYPGAKITTAGFTKLLVENNPRLNVSSINGEKIDPLKLSTVDGHIREVKVKYMPRVLTSQVATEDTCDNNLVMGYNESEITAPLFRSLSFYLPWGFLERYAKEASNLKSIAQPRIGVLQELEDQLMNTVNGLIGSIDAALLAQIVWGINQTTGANTAKAININKDSSVFDLSNGIIELLYDAKQNEIMGTPLIVGSGLFEKFEMLKPGIGTAQNGVNMAALNAYKFYADYYAPAAGTLGANQVGVFAPGTVGLVDIDRYIAWKTGRHGTSEFAQIALPVENPNGGPAAMMVFNLQIKEFDCPVEVATQYGTQTLDRGYQVILSKNFGLWQQPTDAYQTGDRLEGNNGSLRYELSNDCDPCVVA